mmetsp:Transcript_18188/g.36743  ORF Transcript_18188/g.36743 Transcript_18188/m.36743 type:complete len:389 (-) Transcript_18188:1210-2376(-)
MYTSTTLVRERDEVTGKQRKHWKGVMTLIHKELMPCLEPIPLDKMGLGEDQRKLCAGRIVVTGAQKEDKSMQYYVNVYQYTSQHPEKQRRLLRALTIIMRFLRERSSLICVMGDMNAAWHGERKGYSGNFDKVDRMLTDWIQGEQLQLPTRSYQHTWESPSGPQKGHLDYIMVWRDQKIKFSAQTLVSPHPSHDHLFVHAKFGGDIIIRPSVAEEEKVYPRLDFHDWPLCKDQWAALTAAAVQELQKQELDPITMMERSWKVAYDIAFDLIGKWPKKIGAPAYRNKTTRRLLKHITHLRKALQELEEGRQRSKAMETDPMTLTEEEWSQQSLTKIAAFLEAHQGMPKDEVRLTANPEPTPFTSARIGERCSGGTTGGDLQGVKCNAGR